MTTHDMPPQDTPDINDTLRWQLRALRRDETPTRDLWPAIATSLHAQKRTPRRTAWLAPVAMATSLLLVVGAIGLWHGAPALVASSSTEYLVQREADGLTRQYRAALQEFAPLAPPESLAPTFAVLDRDAALIRDALEQAPDSRLLLEQLRRTYAHRLALVQRVAYS